MLPGADKSDGVSIVHAWYIYIQARFAQTKSERYSRAVQFRPTIKRTPHKENRVDFAPLEDKRRAVSKTERAAGAAERLGRRGGAGDMARAHREGTQDRKSVV